MSLKPEVKSSVRPRNHARNIALLFIATGAIFALYGTGLGTVMLALLAGIHLPFSASGFAPHPYAQIYGFIFEFIMGVAYILVPRFKGEKPGAGWVSLAYLSYLLLTASDVILLITSFYPSMFLLGLASASFLIGVCIFSFQTWRLAFEQKGGFPETNPLIAESAVAALLSAIVLVLANYPSIHVQVDIFSEASIYLNLLGFASSMIYAVEIRSVSFRQSDYRSIPAKLTWIAQGAAILTCFVSILFPSMYLLLLSGCLFLLSAVFAVLSLKLFGVSHPLMYRPSMTPTHYRIMTYNDMAMIPAFLWLYLALILSILMIIFPSEASSTLSSSSLTSFLLEVGSSIYVRDLFIHAVAIGFIGSTVVCFAPMLLPGLLGRRGPTTGLSYYPIILLNAGMFIRAAGDVIAIKELYIPSWTALSGPLILLAMLWFLFMIHNIGRAKIEARATTTEEPVLDEKYLRSVAEIRIKPEQGWHLQGKEDTIALWFVYHGSRFYLLPRQLESFDEIAPTLGRSGGLSFELKGRDFRATYVLSTDTKTVKIVSKLFKDKYGQRNFRNFFGNGKDGLVLVLELIQDQNRNLTM
ncbi:MAG: hypothetical protein JRN68_06845 [Nitrososphaerota archaeon]|nr:hypothetical protein [Nitrososphaerota archaeon]